MQVNGGGIAGAGGGGGGGRHVHSLHMGKALSLPNAAKVRENKWRGGSRLSPLAHRHPHYVILCVHGRAGPSVVGL